MPEWWTYQPSDFLMFSARTWGRLVEGWNAELWPLQPLLVLAAIGLVAAAAVRGPTLQGAITAVLALAWIWVGWAFHWERFSTINTGASWMAAAFAVQAALLLALGSAAGPPPSRGWRQAGLVIAAGAALAYPLLAPLAGQAWARAEVAGALPDPTTMLTVGLLLALPLRHRRWLLPIPLLALLVGWTTAWLLWTK
jgi:hypothetical protein